MSNICRRCGSLIEYSLVSLSKIKNSHCHFCISEFKTMTDKLDKEREKRLEGFKKSLAERTA